MENGNKLAAAKRLGLSRATLYNKMNKFGIFD
ncbi:helix-turn-helix domain-containing protein [Paenibacillus sp. DMB20]